MDPFLTVETAETSYCPGPGVNSLCVENLTLQVKVIVCNSVKVVTL